MAKKTMKPLMGWAGVVEGKIHAWRHMEQPYAEIYLRRKDAKKNYERIVRVKITPITKKRAR